MKRLIVSERLDAPILEMARVGFIPPGSQKTIEVYVHTDDSGKTPHFHVRKYGKNNSFEWEACILYERAGYFAHGHYNDTLPDKKTTKALDKMLRQIDPKSRDNHTYWQLCVEEWNRNNSDVELDLDLTQPDYTQLG